jgi:hypothetical protein
MSGVTIVPGEAQPLAVAVVSSSASTISVISAIAAAGTTPAKVIRVYKLFLVMGAAGNIGFLDGSTALSGAMPFSLNGSITLNMDGCPWFTTTPGNAFQITNASTVLVTGTVYYTQTQFTG